LTKEENISLFAEIRTVVPKDETEPTLPLLCPVPEMVVWLKSYVHLKQ
jgi:hypothetical protein